MDHRALCAIVATTPYAPYANASRPYHRLRTLPGEAPLLPAGYPAMMLTALVPPLFFQRVHPLIDGGAGRAA